MAVDAVKAKDGINGPRAVGDWRSGAWPPDPSTVLFVEQYAQRVLDFSAQYGSDASFSYTAANCLGLPAQFPSYGDSPQTFVLMSYGPFWEKLSPTGQYTSQRGCTYPDCPCHGYLNFVDLLYPHSVIGIAIYIYETYNPGCVREIWGGDCLGNWTLLWRSPSDPEFPGHQPRAFSPPLLESPWPIQMVRVIFDHRCATNHPEIDAVALLGSYPQTTTHSSLLASNPILRMVLDLRIKAGSSQDPGFLALLGTNLSTTSLSELQTFAESSSCEPILTANVSLECQSSFASLPREVLFMIFQRLDLWSLRKCARVCKLFCDIAQDPKLYSNVCLKSLFHSVCDLTLESLAPKMTLTTYLNLSWCGNYGKISSGALATFLATIGSSLRQLRLSNCHVANAPVLTQLARSCSDLVELNLSNCHLLDSRDFSTLSELRKLKLLNLYRTRIGQRELNTLIRSNEGLLMLNVSACRLIDGDETAEALSVHCPNLVALEMWRNSSLTWSGVDSLCQLPFLRELDLGWCTSVDATTGSLVRLTQKCPRLEKVFLTAHRQTTDRDILAMAAKLPRLEQLDIMGTKNVGVGAIRTLLRDCSRLSLLDVSYCELLEDPLFLNELKTFYPACHFVSSSNL
ncbi:hypothetical protein TCAL_00886 [Tigriopus californicus]|uniref:F-box domain-containing protein n=1 Tax=Tigriopus californicus TaxID=6832 RepID=A0A553NEK2_TIGCA|nr:F-box/LRR-repeat protein 4-like [Tigriopus californicus]TRY63872.1 hypothetical protein TCAL_00886 [Tigriopus californicus]